MFTVSVVPFSTTHLPPTRAAEQLTSQLPLLIPMSREEARVRTSSPLPFKEALCMTLSTCTGGLNILHSSQAIVCFTEIWGHWSYNVRNIIMGIKSSCQSWSPILSIFFQNRKDRITGWDRDLRSGIRGSEAVYEQAGCYGPVMSSSTGQIKKAYAVPGIWWIIFICSPMENTLSACNCFNITLSLISKLSATIMSYLDTGIWFQPNVPAMI